MMASGTPPIGCARRFGHPVSVPGHELICGQTGDGVYSRELTADDSLFIATARWAAPVLLAAVNAALAVHAPGPVRRSWDLDLRCEAHDWTKHSIRSFGIVRECPDCGFREYRKCVHDDSNWPCATAKVMLGAAEAALGQVTGNPGGQHG